MNSTGAAITLNFRLRMFSFLIDYELTKPDFFVVKETSVLPINDWVALVDFVALY